MIHDTIERHYWTMQQASEQLGITATRIRFYDRKLNLMLHKNKAGYRSLTATQIGKLAVIVRLRKYCTLLGIAEAFRKDEALEILDKFEPGHGLSLEEDLRHSGHVMKVCV